MKLSKKENKQESLFFIAISPIGLVQESIYEVKSSISQKYDTKGAFRSPAHITLQMPFKKKDNKMPALVEALTDFSGRFNKFDIQLNGFGAFEPRVVFIQVEENDELEKLQAHLQKLLKQFQIFHSTYKLRGFNPHITVAFRDLQKHQFYKLWEVYKDKDFDANFRAEGITLYKHNGKEWEEHLFFPFNEN